MNSENMNIEVLSQEVVNQIAAGEVIERPSHLVKELVENSLDAGATEIEIEFAFGGKQVRVHDNGKGISKKDLPLALIRHATSKIRCFPDIWSLNSYGFRGEALASIAAVSKVKLSSKTDLQETAYQLDSHFGKFEEPVAIGGELGTTIGISDLFANIPARLKFLKSETAEGTQIKNVLKAMAMAYPHVNFRVRQNGKLLFYWPTCEDRKTRVQQVLEQEDMYLGQGYSGGIQAEAVVSSPNNTAKTRRQMWMFAQNRWVQDSSIQAATMDAYRSLLMHGEYPIAAVWVTCNPDEVDVNIHPTKSQVKFRQPSDSFKSVLRAVRGCLEKAPWLHKSLGQNLGLKKDFSQKNLSQEEKTGEVSQQVWGYGLKSSDFNKTQFQQKSFDWVKPPPSDSSDHSNSRDSSDSRDSDVPRSPDMPMLIPIVKPPPSDSDSCHYGGEVRESFQEYIPTQTETKAQAQTQPKTQTKAQAETKIQSECQNRWSHLQILGQADLTYIVTQSDGSILFVDQHAAHERVAYERLMKSWSMGNFEVQQFLLPETISLSEDLVQTIIEIKDELLNMGLSVEATGPQEISVTSSPSIVKPGALPKVFEQLASEKLEKGGSFAFEKYVRDIFATMACHSVIRAGQALSHEEMASLLVQMDEFPLSSFCPHGRPVYVEYPFSQLEKDFGRVV